jgi:hypothetical protein
MPSLDNVLQQLRQEHNRAQSDIQKLEKAITTIEGLTGRNSAAAVNGTRGKRRMSAAARKRIAQAQRARWAKLRKPPQPAATTKATGRRAAKQTLSPEGRKKIAAAAKARWARFRARQNKRAA